MHPGTPDIRDLNIPWHKMECLSFGIVGLRYQILKFLHELPRFIEKLQRPPGIDDFNPNIVGAGPRIG